MVWSALQWEATAGPVFVISGEGDSDVPVAIPLFTTTDRWLWLRLELQVPAGVEAPRLGAMRVLYPEISIVQQLPAIFQGADNDPGGALRRLVGVLETTTQQIDGSIRDAATQLDPSRAKREWLDHLAGALGLPWHRALPEGAKRRQLQAAGDLLDKRGRRAGLLQLLQCIVSPGHVSLVDLTADYVPLRVGGGGQAGAALPALLAGVPRSLPRLSGKARLGRARLDCATTRCDPMETIFPTLRIELATTAEIKQAVAPLLDTILADYVPAGLRTEIRWRVLPAALLSEADELVLDGNGPGTIGGDSMLGRTVLAGRAAGVGSLGVGMGFRLR
jgi:phage tail-like protein